MLAGTKERVSRYLALLVRCEESVGDFYHACAATWPREKDFWQRLADEETDHAVRLEMVRERIHGTPHGVGLVHPFPEGTIQTFLRSVEESTEKVRAGGITMVAALTQARDLEQSRIASQPLRGLSFDDPRFVPYQQEFAAEVLEHSQRAVDRMQEAYREHPAAA